MNIGVVHQLLTAGADVHAQDDNFPGCTALSVAVASGSSSIIEALLGAGAAVNVKDLIGETPLMNAAKEGHLLSVRLLIAAGADLTLRSDDHEGYSAVDLAKLFRHTEVQELLEQAIRGRAPVGPQGLQHA